MLSKIRAIYTVVEFVVTIVITIIFMYLLGDNHRKARVVWAKMQKYLMGFKMHIDGKIDEEANILIINHQSLIDIVVLEDIHPKDLCWIAKQELADIPIFGHILKAPKMITVKREDKRSMLKLFKDVKDRVKKGRVIAIFPEGTRGEGQRLLKFKDGAKFLSESLKLKIQPVVICGSRRVLDSQNLQAHSGVVKIKFLPSFYPEKDTTWYEDLQINMQKELDIELANNTSYR